MNHRVTDSPNDETITTLNYNSMQSSEHAAAYRCGIHRQFGIPVDVIAA